jgi:large subunit ribosomal protein L35
VGARKGALRTGLYKQELQNMPKLKTNRAAAKRIRKTAKGYKAYSAGRRHNLGHKDRKRKRHLRSGGSSLVDKSDVGRLPALLPNH